MNKQDAIDYFGSRAELARQLGVSASNVPKWKEIPKWHQKAIERITKGKLKADCLSAAEMQQFKRVSYYLPKENYELFKKKCKKENVSMRLKLNELIEKELN